MEITGHRLMVQVQSSWFPLYDRNPQKFVPNIFTASLQDYQKATQGVWRDTQRPSHIAIPVVGGAVAARAAGGATTRVAAGRRRRTARLAASGLSLRLARSLPLRALGLPLRLAGSLA